jgi:sec-independent protein translocase protein TatB
MLPGLGFSEILVLGVLALLVVGPKDLPLMLRSLGRWNSAPALTSLPARPSLMN